MTEILAKNEILHLPKFSAGERLSVQLAGTRIDGNSQIYLMLKNRATNKTYSVSQIMNAGNDFTAELNLMTVPVFEDFSKADAAHRCWLYVEAFDVANQISVAQGFTVLTNSALLTGTNPADIPDVKNILTHSDFEGIDFDNVNNLDAAAEALRKAGAILKGKTNE